MNKYFKFIEDEAELDKQFDDDLQNNLSNTAREAAQFFSTTAQNEFDGYRRKRLSRLLTVLVSKLPNEKPFVPNPITGVALNTAHCPACGEGAHNRHLDGSLSCRKCAFIIEEGS